MTTPPNRRDSSEAATEAAATTTTTTTTPTDSDAKQISLNVRTLDHTTYPITIWSNASVLQLKELVAIETGVVFARQRLIFRGKVLKNDQSISAYSLEDGHTLHLVARAENAVPPAAESQQTSASNAESNTNNSTGNNTGPNANGPARPARNNDEPDPTIGSSMPTNHVLMGATITVPEGSDVSMPFLSSMIANIMSSVHGSMAGNVVISEADPGAANAAAANRESGPRASMAHFVSRAGVPAPSGGGSRSRRSRAEPSLRSLGGSSRSRASAGTTTHGLATLRARSETLLETIRSNVENTDYDFAGLDEVQLDNANGSDTAFLQSQLTQLEILLDHFRSRLHLLPVALESRSSANAGASQHQPSVTATVRTIDTLQTIGESADLLARIARYLFIRHNPGFAGGSIRLSEGVSLRPLASSTGASPAGSSVPTAGGEAATVAAVNESTRRSGSERRSSSSRRRQSSTTSSRNDSAQGSEDGARAGGNPLFSLLERMNESIRGVTAGLTGSTDSNSSSASTDATRTEAPEPPSGASAASPQAGLQHAPQISIAGLGPPLASVVFPISFADLNANTTTWNFAELLNRLSGELPASTLFGIITGDPVSIHQVMAQTGFALVSGVDVPPVSRATIRTWSHTFVIELRQQLRSQGIPASILSEIEPHRQSSFIDQLIRPLEPFIPDLVDFFLRATSASRTAAFGTSSFDFLGTMSRQFVRHMRTYVGGDDERLQRVLRDLLVYLGLDTRLASFAVANFLEWAGSRRRPLDGSATAESGPASKRQREGQP